MRFFGFNKEKIVKPQNDNRWENKMFFDYYVDIKELSS